MLLFLFDLFVQKLIVFVRLSYEFEIFFMLLDQDLDFLFEHFLHLCDDCFVLEIFLVQLGISFLQFFESISEFWGDVLKACF